ncbi:MAG TPA: MFS transporter [Acidimicrobiales bacterium]|nr:MFS transporter [Acidimicrobiales bacterium]
MTTQTMPTAPIDQEPDPLRWWALGVIAFAQLMVVLDATVVNIALPSAQRDLHISTLNRQWVITAYTLAFGGLLLLGGRIADFVGRKRIFIIGLIGFALASALGGLAQNQEMLFAARALQGSFGALMAPASLSLLTVTFTETRERAKAFGVYGAIAGGGAAIGLILGGVLTQYATWRWCLLINTPIGVVAASGAIRFIKESKAHGDTRYDLPGALSATIGLVALVYGFTMADQDGWSSPTTIGYLVAAMALLVVFVLIELRTKHPLLPMRILEDRNRGGSFLGSFMAGVGLFGMFLFLTYYLQGTLGYSALKSGIAYLPFSAGIIFAAGMASKLLPRYGPRPLMGSGFFACSVGLAWLITIGVHSSYWAHVLPAELIMSIGLGFAFVSLSSTALIGVADHDAGVASAMVNTTQQVGGSLGTALLNTFAASATASYLVDHVGHHRPSKAIAQVALVSGYHRVFSISSVMLLGASIACFALVEPIKRRRSRATGQILEQALAN